MTITSFLKLVSFLLVIILFTACDGTQEPTALNSTEKTLQSAQELACAAIPTQTDLVQLSNVFSDSKDLSSSLVQTSKYILKLSNSLTNAGDNISPEYVETTLSLSQDILEMAENIGLMADKILVMGDEIGEMANRILETQVIQSQNLETVQENIIAAQEKINLILYEN